MKAEDYWIHFWKTNSIVEKTNAQEKIGRTINGLPIDEHKWQMVLDDLESQLTLKTTDRLLDIGAGSGVISIPFSKKIKEVVAVDVSDVLLNEMASISNIQTITNDVRECDFKPFEFDKIIIYFAIQHFSEEETAALITACFKWLSVGGILYIGDVPDVANKFIFFNTTERQYAYFNSLVNKTPIIGTWFQKEYFNYLGKFAGFSKTEIIEQPTTFINAHYRFDVKYIK
jgi:cyclopropane fatty-acyl-phospholipid synthase-like methyltransferase